MTIQKILKWANGRLLQQFYTSSSLDSEILLAYVLNCAPTFIYSYPNFILSKTQISKFKKLINHRVQGEPIAYLTGNKEFYKLNFIVNKSVLIPRPETELMVTSVLAQIKKTNLHQSYTLIDIGTGSGCIVISILKNISKLKPYPLKITMAIDISKKSLSLAEKNAKLHKVKQKIKFLHGDLIQPLLKNKKIFTKQNALIFTANLPYLKTSQQKKYTAENIGLKFEPHIALYAGKDGLNKYRQLFKQFKQINKIKTAPIWAYLEIDDRQYNQLKKIIHLYLPSAKIKIKKDLAGLKRLFMLNF